MAMNKRKTTTAVVAGVAAVALILGGTFAWTSISQQARNETIVDINPGGRLHDDFNGANKDIYVENFADKDSGVPIFARIRLDEYMEIGPDAGEKRDDPARKAVALDNDETDTNTPDINDVTTWETYIPGTDSIEHKKSDNDTVYTAYWDWTLGRTDELPYYMPTFNKNKDSLKADINGTYDGLIPGDIVHYDDYTEYKAGDTTGGTEIHDWDTDTAEEDESSEYDNGGVTYSDTTEIDKADVYHKVIADTDADVHTAAQITYGSNVISMSDWLALPEDDQIGPFWVYDSDGWAYWAQPIEPGETTGLLLDGINMTKTPDENWYYGINAVGQFTTAADWETFLLPADQGGAGADSMTPEAQDLMYMITTPKEIKAVLTQNDATASDGSATYTLSFLSTRDELVAGEAYAKPGASGVSTLAEGDGTAAQAEDTNGDIMLEVYDDVVGEKVYTYEAPAPWYEYVGSITAVNIDTKIAPETTAYWFHNMTALTTIDVGNIDTSNTLTMRGMFHTMSNLTSIDGMADWDVSGVKDMESMLGNCTSITSLEPLRNWDVQNVEIMHNMFFNTRITSVEPIANWDTGSVTNMANMFTSCISLTDATPIANWDTSSVTDMAKMFNGCTTLEKVAFGTGWDTSNVTDMSYMFASCTNLASINGIGGWDVSSVTDMQRMFYACKALTSLDLSGWGANTRSVETMAGMFNLCSNLGSINVSNWDTSSVVDMYAVFANSTNLGTITGIENWNVSNVTRMRNMFQGPNKLTSLDLSKWDTGNVTDMFEMFYNCTALTETVDCSKWNVGKVTDHTSFALNAPMVTLPDAWTTAYVVLVQNGTDADSNPTYTMNFIRAETAPAEGDMYNGTAITAVYTDFENKLFNHTNERPWDSDSSFITTVNIVDSMYPVYTTRWFANMKNLTTVNGLEKIDTSNTVSFRSMFNECHSLEKIEGISNWDTSKLEETSYMFLKCLALKELDLSGWDTSSMTDMNQMFYHCSVLETLNLGPNWDTSNVTIMGNVFSACASLTFDCSGWNVDNVTEHVCFAMTELNGTTPLDNITPPTWKDTTTAAA